LDPHRRQAGEEKVMVSHGHTDHLGAHREVILSEPTAWFMHARLGGRRVEHIRPFAEPGEYQFENSRFSLTLLPAGHILGSAMAWIETGRKTLLYTGDFKLRPGRAAEPCVPRVADVLIMETTFGRPRYQFPDPAAVLRQAEDFCRRTLEAGGTPVLLAYALGKSQELLQGLASAGWPILVHDQVRKFLRIYEHFGHRFAPYEKFEASQAAGKVILWPPQADRTALAGLPGPVRLAAFTGWAMDSSCRFRWGTDAAFPLSDHADFNELLEMVRLVRPKTVFTVHGFAAEFAQTLRELGYDARALSENDQLWLPLNFSR
jgi:Cft2 family RNA processing exonuclease